MGIKSFAQGFIYRKGGHIFSAAIISKILSFTLSLIIIRILTKEDYGNLKYAYTIISFIMPFMGMGIFQSFLKYAPVQKYLYERKSLFRYTFIKGCIASSLLILLIIIFSGLATQKVPNAYWYLITFSFLIISHFIFESIKNYLRIFYLNKAYAHLEIIHSVMVFISGAILTFYFGGIGYILSLISVPLLLSIWLLAKKKILSKSMEFPSINKSKYWTYGIYTSLGGLVAQLIYAVDIISIGNILEDSKSIAQYSAISLIPFSLLFLPLTILKTDFVKLVQEATNRTYLVSYVKNFMLIFFFISIVLVLASYLFGNWFILQIFGQDYLEISNLLLVFTFGIAGAFMFRVPFGNIMVAIGWTKINTTISIFTLLVDLILNYFWIKEYGIIGAAYATSLLLWLSGLATFSAFIVYIRRLDKS